MSENARKRGPKVLFNGQKRRAVAEAAMALKRARIEPTVDAVVAKCPSAAYRDDTGEAFNKNLILQVRVFSRVGEAYCFRLCTWRSRECLHA